MSTPEPLTITRVYITPGKGWIAEVKGFGTVLLPFTNQAPRELVIADLTSRGHIIELGGNTE